MSAQTTISALIVDNNLMSRQTLTTILRQSINLKNIFQSSTARDALNIAKQQEKIDWVFADAEMTDNDAFRFLEQLRSIDSGKDAAIIMISSTASREILLKAASAGVTDFIKKPFTANTLTLKLRRLIDGKVQRRTQRVAIFEAIAAELQFRDQTINSDIVDLSAGGCLVKCSLPFSAQVYESVNINIKLNGTPITVNAELARLERCQEEGDKKLFAAFEFRPVDDAVKAKLAQLINNINVKSAK